MSLARSKMLLYTNANRSPNDKKVVLVPKLLKKKKKKHFSDISQRFLSSNEHAIL